MPDHELYAEWLKSALGKDEPFGLSDMVLSSFVRVVTLRRVFPIPTPLEQAMQFADILREHPTAVGVRPGRRHWEIFRRLCHEANARGNLVPDAFVAALAVEAGATLITTDRDFARFPGLTWRHPLAA